MREKLHEVVKDPEVARKLTPDQVVGCKRLCVDTGYWETFNQDHVHLVDLRETPIEAITPSGIRTTAGDHELDVIIYATGFDAMTGALLRIDIRGRDGRALQDAWAAGPRTYLGLGVEGFPNLFTITGPGSPSVLTNMMVSIQQHVEWIADCIGYLDDQGHATIEASLDAQDAWVDFVELRRQLHPLPHLQLVVPRRQRARQDPRLHAAARLPDLRRAVRQGGRGGLLRLRARGLTSPASPGRARAHPEGWARGDQLAAWEGCAPADQGGRSDATAAAELVPAGTDERSGHEEQQREQELTLQQLDHADDDEDDSE